MTITVSERVDAGYCDVLRGSDGPVYFLLGGSLHVVHEVLGRWLEPGVGRAERTARMDVEHWLVTASVGRCGRPAVFQLRRFPGGSSAASPGGADLWTVRAERRCGPAAG